MAVSRSDILGYLLKEYFRDDVEEAARATGYTVAQLNAWRSGKKEPQKKTLTYVIQSQIVPQFKVVVEYGELNVEGKSQKGQLTDLLNGHHHSPGIYAFYDGLANLVYVGKATKLLPEITQALAQPIKIDFPKGVKIRPECRANVVRYVSAYNVGQYDHVDFPKHVESLLLRISKPRLNKNIGFLERALSLAPRE